MGLPNTDKGSSTGRKCSVVLVLLDYNKYFCFRGHWKLERGPSHSPFIKMYGWFYSKPYADTIGGTISAHLVAWSSKSESQACIFVTCQPRLKASTKRIFSLFSWQPESTATNPHTDESQSSRFRSPFLLLNHLLPPQRREAILLIYKHPDYATIEKHLLVNDSQLKAKAHPIGVRE